MASRAMLLTLLLLGWRQFGPAIAAPALLFTWPYGSDKDRQRFLVIDIAVVLAAMLFIVVVLYFF